MLHAPPRLGLAVSLAAAGLVALACVRAYLRMLEEEDVEAAAERAEPGALPALPEAEAADVRAAVPSSASALFVPLSPYLLYDSVQKGLGQGGFGSVSVATARSSGEQVAIKCFNDSGAGELERCALAHLRARGIREGSPLGRASLQEVRRKVAKMQQVTRSFAEHEVCALQAVKGLRSPLFIDMLSAHADGGNYYIATALAGRTLDKALPALPLRDRLKVLQRTAAALAHLHAAGCAHRDIKPDNIALRVGEPLQPCVVGARAQRQAKAPGHCSPLTRQSPIPPPPHTHTFPPLFSACCWTWA